MTPAGGRFDRLPGIMLAGMDATPAAETPAHPTLDDRIEIGLQQAKDLPVEELGDPTCRTKRPDIVDVLRFEGRDRIAELLPLRHARMAVCPLATLRGSASVMAAALGARKSTDLIVQLCGDAHLSKFRDLRLARAGPRLRCQRF